MKKLITLFRWSPLALIPLLVALCTTVDLDSLPTTAPIVTDDTIAPVITIPEPNPIKLTLGATFTKPAVTASDNVDGDLTSSILATGTINTANAGTQKIIYTVSDAAKNETKDTLVVIITDPNSTDKDAPVITISGSNPLSIKIGSSFTEPTVTAIDAVDGDISSSILKTGIIDTATLGQYKIYYEVNDKAGNTGYDTLLVTVNEDGTSEKDTTAPVITIHTANPSTINIGDNLTDSVTATDETDGNITDSIKKTGTINNGTSGQNKIYYEVSDKAGNKAYDTLVVNVIDPESKDDIAPVITVTGDNPDTINIGETSTTTVKAIDAVDGDITAKITTTGSVDNTKGGKYTIVKTSQDAAGNKDSVELIVVVIDNVKPVISIPSPNPINLDKDATFTEPTITATDETDGDISANIQKSGTIDTATAGTQKIYYTVSDAAGNSAYDTLVVIVTDQGSDDKIAPVITISPDKLDTININENLNNTVSATDDSDGDITANIVTTGDLDKTKGGIYSVIYTVTDKAGNEAKDTLIVVVLDNVAPVLTIPNPNPLTINVNGTYTKPAVTAIDETDGDITANIVISGETVNTAVADTYSVIFTIKDVANNEAKDTLDVIVEPDKISPQITLKGFDTVDVYLGYSYVDSGATATDNIDENLTDSIKITSTVDTNAIGNYTVTYIVTDAGGNADTVVRYVNVPNPLTVEDFELGELDQIAIKGLDESAGYWYSYVDHDNAKDSSKIEPGEDTVIAPKVVAAGANSGSLGLYAKYTLRGGDYPYATMAFSLGGTGEFVDLSRMTSLECYMKGSGTVRINFTTKMIDDTVAANSNMWGAFGKDVVLSGTWTKIVINATDIKLPTDADLFNKSGWAWGDANASNKVGAIEFEVTGNQVETAKVVEMYLDDIKFNY